MDYGAATVSLAAPRGRGGRGRYSQGQSRGGRGRHAPQDQPTDTPASDGTAVVSLNPDAIGHSTKSKPVNWQDYKLALQTEFPAMQPLGQPRGREATKVDNLLCKFFQRNSPMSLEQLKQAVKLSDHRINSDLLEAILLKLKQHIDGYNARSSYSLLKDNEQRDLAISLVFKLIDTSFPDEKPSEKGAPSTAPTPALIAPELEKRVEKCITNARVVIDAIDNEGNRPKMRAISTTLHWTPDKRAGSLTDPQQTLLSKSAVPPCIVERKLYNLAQEQMALLRTTMDLLPSSSTQHSTLQALDKQIADCLVSPKT